MLLKLSLPRTCAAPLRGAPGGGAPQCRRRSRWRYVPMDLRDYALYAGLYLLSRLVYVLLRKGWPAEERRCVSLCLRVCMCVCVCVCPAQQQLRSHAGRMSHQCVSVVRCAIIDWWLCGFLQATGTHASSPWLGRSHYRDTVAVPRHGRVALCPSNLRGG
jgi:hypothetical protein